MKAHSLALGAALAAAVVAFGCGKKGTTTTEQGRTDPGAGARPAPQAGHKEAPRGVAGDTPEAVFRTATDAMLKGDSKTYVDCLTPQGVRHDAAEEAGRAAG